MKSKKLISFLCAAAMTTSAFAGLAVTASAATTGDIIWSDNFDAQNTGVFLNGTSENAATNNTAIPGLTFVTANRNGGDKGTYEDENGDTVLGGSYYAVNEKTSSDKYLRLSFPVFGDYTKNGRWAYVDLPETAVATADKDLVMDFDVKLTKGLKHGETDTSYTPVLRIGSFDVDTKAATAVAIDETATGGNDWTHARIVVSNSTGAKLYIGGTEVASAANADVKSLDKIGLYSTDGESCGAATVDLITYSYAPSTGTSGAATTGDSYADADKQTYTPLADLDNVVIYQETAGEANGTSAAPGAQTGETGEKVEDTTTNTTIPAAPTLAAPDGVTGLQTYNFDSNAVKTWPFGTDAQSITDISGLTITMGGRDKGGDPSTYAAVKKTASGNALQLSACKYATAGRAPYLSFNTGLPVDLDTNTSTAISFAVRLSAADGYSDATPRLFFLKDATQQGSDGNGAYRNVAAVLTTVEGETIYRGDDSSSDAISAYITPDEWHYVTLVVTPGDGKNTHRLYVDTDPEDTKAEPVVKVDYVATGENASSMDNLPILAVESKAAKVDGVDQSPSYGVATLDNILVYQGTVSEPRKLIATPGEAPEPTESPVENHTVSISNAAQVVTITDTDENETETYDAVLIHAAYNTDKTLKSVKSYDAKNISTTGIQVTIPDTDTVSVGDTFYVWDSLKGMVPYGEGTATTGVQNYNVTGTIDSGIAKVVFTDSTDATKKYESTNGTVSVPAGTYNITVEAKSGYTDATVTAPTPATITVSTDVASGAFTATSKKLYSVAVDTITGGTVTPDKTSAKEGDTVTLTVSAAENYQLKAVKVMNGTTEVTTAAGEAAGTYTFTMPAADVTVSAEFAQEYAITKADATNGSFTVVSKAIAGTEITVTASPEAGYELDTITVTPTTVGSTTTVTVADGKFTMPAEPVTVTVTFKASTKPAITGTVTITGTAKVGETLTANATINDGATPKYQWQANTGAEGAYENIADATSQTFVIPATLVGNTIKVVVSADEVSGSKESDPTAAVAAKTYTVTGTLGAGVASAVLRPQGAEDDTTDVTGTVNKGTVTYTVPAGTYTVVATAAEGYKNAVSDPATVVAADENAVLAFTTSATRVYTVSGTADDGVASVTLTEKLADESTETPATYTATLAAATGDNATGQTVTVANVPAGTYTVSATAKAGYKNATSTPAEVTVTDADITNLAVTTTAKVKSAITTDVKPDADAGTVELSVADATQVEEGTEVTVTATAGLGYLADTPAVITVAPTTEDSQTTVTVTDGKFTMPAEPVKVTVAFTADPTMVVLSATKSTWVKSGDTTAHGDDTELQINQMPINSSKTYENETALLQYTVPAEYANKITKALLNFDAASASYDTNKNRWANTGIWYAVMTNTEWDASTAVFTDVSSYLPTSVIKTTTLDRTKVNESDPAQWTGTDSTTAKDVADGHGVYANYNVDVTDGLASASGDTAIALGTSTARKQLVKKAPKLVLTIGQTATFTVSAAADENTKVAGAVVEVKKDNATVAKGTTDATGVAKIALDAGTYTYTVTSADYAIKKDGTLTVADTAVSEPVSLAANVPTSVVITAPEAGTSYAQGESATYTAKVYDQDEREMTAETVTWSVLDSNSEAATKVTVDGGVVTIAEDATVGDYTVKAVVTSKDTVTDTKALTVTQAVTVGLSISANDTNGTVSYKINGVESTATSTFVGKTVVATATPNSLYGFAGWATSAANATEGTYVSTDATYTHEVVAGDADAGITLIACFTYTGIYASQDFDSEDDYSNTGAKNNKVLTGGIGTWTLNGVNSNSVTAIEDAPAAFTTASGKVFKATGNSVESDLLFDAISSSGSYKIALDMYFTAAGVGDTDFTIGTGDNTTLKLKVAANSTSIITADNTSDGEAVVTQKIYYYNYATQKWVNTGLAPGVYHIEETINGDGTATVKLGSEEISLTSVPNTENISAFTFAGIRVDGSHKGTMTFYVDNVEISVPATSGSTSESTDSQD